MAVLHMDFAGQADAIQPTPGVESEIRQYIMQNESNHYDAVIAKDGRWEVFFHLSTMRESLLNWYEFKDNAELLEIGGGFGALTGLFSDRCAHVTTVESSVFRAEAIHERYADRKNLDIYAGRIENITFKRKFDYVVLVGILENIADVRGKAALSQFLQQTMKLLKPGGTLLLAVENRFGIRYFCGATEPRSGKPFTGLSREGGEDSFSRQELIDLLNESGLGHHKFYYPLPDYKLPQLIYSEHYLPQSELRERLIPYCINPDTLIAVENDLYDELVRNHVFEFFSNSFLVECALDARFCTVLFAAVTTDRGREHSFATTIHQDDTVLKRPLFANGQDNTRMIHENILTLMERGIRVVPHRLEYDGLRMPYIHAPTLSDYLGQIVNQDKTLFLSLIDKLYGCILNSSEHAAPARGGAFNHGGTDNVDFGVILRKAYLDMIPFNCFYIDSNLVFFDQEFVKDDCPAKYVLFRALKYIYLSHPFTENTVPLQFLKEKYELTSLWPLFEKEESQFVSNNRRYDVYRHFYKWTRVDRKKISYNQNLLLAGEYTGSLETIGKLQEIHAVQLDLLKAFIEVCEQHQLRYFVVHGTLLGAIRHQGFIPWDDDLDMAMPREDYEKFKRFAKNAFTEPYVLQTNENDPHVFYGGLSRLRNSNTTGIEHAEIGQSGNSGIWIDIMAFDYIYANPLRRRKQFKRIRLFQRLLLTKTYGVELRNYEEFRLKQRILFRSLAGLMSRKWLLRQFDEACTTCKKAEAGYVGSFTRYLQEEGGRLHDKRLFESIVPVQFEQLSLPAPEEYHAYLSSLFGTHYLKYPPLEQRIPRHPGIFVADVPYLRFTGTFRHARNKKFVLFGSGQMSEHYLFHHGRKYPPLFIVDNDQAKWNTQKHGISIRNPQELLNFNKQELRLVICSVHYRAISEQLEQMGIREYYIYIQNKDWL